MLGKKHTLQAIIKIKERRRLQSIKGFSLETRRKMSESHRGEKAWNWKGGSSTEAIKIRSSFEMKLWREAVFERDKWTCIWCQQIGGKLNADHIKPFCDYPELRFAIDNGRTLCLECHKKTDTYMCKARWNKKL